MTTLLCLALIVYHEARSEPIMTQSLVAQVALNRADNEKLTLCDSMKKPRSYSFYWDGKPNRMLDNEAKGLALTVSKEALNRYRFKNMLYFNHIRLGKRFKTKTPARKSGKLIFY